MTMQTWDQLTANGLTRRDITRQLGSGELTHVRRGAYAPAADLDARGAHLQLAQATWLGLRPGGTISHFTAALLHGLPVPPGQLERIWLTRAGVSGGRSAGHVRLVRGELDDRERLVRGGMWVTTLDRTTADCALRCRLPDALMIVDAALRQGAGREALCDRASQWGGRRGIGVLRKAAELGDARSESPGESRSRALFALYGLPMPELQVVVGDHEDPIARVDFLWRQQRLVGEFDGRIKYSEQLAPGGDPSEAVWQEKLREDRLRRAGFRVERWTWADTLHPAELITRLRHALARS